MGFMLQMLYASDLCFYRLKFKQSLGISSAIEKLRYDFLNIKAEIEEWGEIVSNSCQPMEFIKSKYGGICKNIEQ